MQTDTTPALSDFKAAYAAELHRLRVRDYGTGAGYDPLPCPAAELDNYRLAYLNEGAPEATVRAHFPTRGDLEAGPLPTDAATVDRMIDALKAGRASYSGNYALKRTAAAHGLATSAAFNAWLKEAL